MLFVKSNLKKSLGPFFFLVTQTMNGPINQIKKPVTPSYNFK
jgi:hypothetical protein